MKFPIASLVAISCLLAVPTFALVPSDSLELPAAALDADLPTVSIGGGIAIKNNSASAWIVTPKIGGVAGEPVIVPAGGSATFSIPNNPALVGLQVSIVADILMLTDDTDAGWSQTYLITK